MFCVYHPKPAPALAVYSHSPSRLSATLLLQSICFQSIAPPFALRRLFAKNESFRISRLQTLLRRHLEQVISFLFLPHALQKTPGWGYPPYPTAGRTSATSPSTATDRWISSRVTTTRKLL